VQATVAVTADGSVTINGERVQGPVAVKTEVLDDIATISGTLGVYNQDQYPILMSAPTKQTYVYCGGCYVVIEDISTSGWLGDGDQPDPLDPEDSASLTFAYYIKDDIATKAHSFLYLPNDGSWDIELDYSIMISGQRLWRTRTHSPGQGRDASPVFAKETAVADEWKAKSPLTWDVSFGDLVWSTDPYPTITVIPIKNAMWHVIQHKGKTGYTYADVSVNWSSVEVSFDGMGKTVSPLRFTGSGNTITMDLVTDFGGDAEHTITIARPHIFNFANFNPVNRSDELLDELKVSSFTATNHYPETLDWSTDPA